MSHTGVDVIDFLLLTAYPVGALFIIEIISRAIKIPSWPKLFVQATVSIGFGIAYVTILPTPHWFTSVILFGLAAILFFQARRTKLRPDKPIY